MREQWNKCQETHILRSSVPLRFHDFAHVTQTHWASISSIKKKLERLSLIGL